MTSWSYSAMTCASTCLKKYEHSYLISTPKDYESGDLVFGTAVHLGINTALTGGNGEETFKIFWETYKDKPLMYGRHKWHDLLGIGIQFLAKFEKYHAKKYVLAFAEERLYAEYKGVKLEGTLDFLGMYENVWTLADFKTSGTKYEDEKAQISFQLYLYAYLAIQNGHRAPAQLMYAPFLKGTGGVQTPVVFPFKEEDMHKALDEFVSYCKLLELGAGPSPFPKNYNQCLSYNRRCEFWNACHSK